MVTAQIHQRVPFRFKEDGAGTAHFAPYCSTCPLVSSCTTSRNGRTITINKHEGLAGFGLSFAANGWSIAEA